MKWGSWEPGSGHTGGPLTYEMGMGCNGEVRVCLLSKQTGVAGYVHVDGLITSCWSSFKFPRFRSPCLLQFLFSVTQ